MLGKRFFIWPWINADIGHFEGVSGEHVNDTVAVVVEGVWNPEGAAAITFSGKIKGVSGVANDGEKAIAIGNHAFFECFVVNSSIREFEGFFGYNYSG